jgi:uncharacterized small protein (DUF1192 family)
MEHNEDSAKRPAEIVIGEDLSMFSVDELNMRIAVLEAEIARVRADIAAKQSSLADAESFFKQG